MKDILRSGSILMAYGIIAGLALGFFNSITYPKIAAQEEAARMAAIREVLPEATVFETVTTGEVEYIKGFADETKERLVGFVITTLGSGFSSSIQTVVGLKPDFTITAIEIVYQSETPGLGTRAVEVAEKGAEPWFESQFDGITAALAAVDKDGGEIKSITGATITSRAIAVSVAEAAKKLENAIGGAVPTDSSHTNPDSGEECTESGAAITHRNCPNFAKHHPELNDSLIEAEGGSK